MVCNEKFVSLGWFVVGVVYEFNNLISFVYVNIYVFEKLVLKLEIYFNVVVDGVLCEDLIVFCYEFKLD